MAAPALVALAHGSRDPRSAATIKSLVAEVKAMRPDLRIETAFLDLAKPSFDTVVDRLVKAGFDEIVVRQLSFDQTDALASLERLAEGRRLVAGGSTSG